MKHWKRKKNKMLLYMKKLSPKSINRHLKTQSLGREILHFKECDSTNRIAKELPSSHGTLIIADSQTAGRGRLNRNWESNKGGIYMSIILPAKDTPVVITLICAIAVRRALGKGYIKWPNDIVIDGKKVCGILCERTEDSIVCGIGVNINNKVSKDIPATSLTGVNPSKLVAEILNELEVLAKCDFKTLKDEYESYCININRTVEAVYENRSVRGIATGVTDDGELKVTIPDDDGNMEITVYTHEVSVRGVYGYV